MALASGKELPLTLKRPRSSADRSAELLSILLVWNDSLGSAISLRGSRGPPGDVAVSSPAVAASLPRFPTPGSAGERGVSAARTKSRRGGDKVNLAPLARKTCRRRPSHGASWPRLAAVAFRPTANPAAYKGWPCRSPIPMLSVTAGTSSDRWRLRDRLCSRLNEGDYLVSDLSPLLRT